MFFFFKQKTAYEMRISDWSSDVCSSDLRGEHTERQGDDGDQRRAHVPQEQGADQPDDDELFRQFVRQVLDRSIDELRPVIGGDDLDSIGKALLELLDRKSVV